VPLRLPRVIVRFRAGPAWTEGTPEEQPGWDEHAAFIDRLVERGTMIMGGPYSDNSGSMSLWEGMNADEARRVVVEPDPFVRNGVFVLEEVVDWTVYVDTRIE
jgi:uncharacterized protein YciI